MTQPIDTSDSTRSESERPASRTRLRLIQIGTVVIVIGAFVGTIYFLGDEARRAQIEVLIQSPGGLLLLFVISAISNATLILPVPGLAITALAATLASPLVIGLVVGSGQTLGEMTGYLAGYSGKDLIDESPRYAQLVKWMDRYGTATIFVLAVTPNPLFDVAGIIAGASHMPLWRFLLPAGAGKIIKNLVIAFAAALGVDWILTLFGG